MNLSYLRTYLPIGLATLSLLLGLTPVYSVGVLLLVITLAAFYPFATTGIFRPVTTRIVVSFLIFMAWVMTLATYGWLTHVSFAAFIYIASYALVYLAVQRKLPAKKTPTSKDQSSTAFTSLIAFGLSLVGVAVMFASFYLPHPSLASSIQIFTNGYDNSAHLSLIRTTYEHNGYVYGSYDQIKDQIAWRSLTAYPQGWHFATAFLWKGTAIPVFIQTTSTPEIIFYLCSIFLWYVLMVFLFHQILWYVLRATKSLLKIDSVSILSFAGLSILLQLLVFWGSLSFGFATFLCALAYLFVFVAAVLHTHFDASVKRSPNQLLVMPIIALLAVAALTQGWLFAMPIVVVSAVVSFSFFIPYIYKNFRTSQSAIITMVIACTIIAIPILVQFMINRDFSVQGASQINDDGGIFGINTTLALAAVLGSLVAVSTRLIRDRTQRITLAGLVFPALGFCGLLLLYQLLTIGHTAYFFTKALALTLCLVWLPLSCLIFALLERVRKNLPSLYVFAFVCIGFLLTPFMFGQDTSSFTRLLQQKSNLTTENADLIARLAENGSLKQYKTFVLTGQNYDGDVIGTNFTSTQGSVRSKCDNDTVWVIITRRNNEVPRYLNECTKHETIQVVVSKDLSPSILHKLDARIKIIE